MNLSKPIDPGRLNKEEKKIVRLAALGGMLEFYDFIIYGIFSVYFAHQFFPSSNPLLAVVKSYIVFILGYIARPIGGILFSHIGDEHGRKRVLIITIVLMGASSLGIGLLPTHDQIGITAPILLLSLRLLQGLALGGELPSTYVYISESMSEEKRGTGFGLTMVGVNAGLLLGMLINQLLNLGLSPAQLSAYGWRFPFIFGGLLCIISYQIRKTLSETSAFIKIQNKPAFPIYSLFKDHFPHILIGISLTSIMSGLVVVAIVFMPTYLNEILGIDNEFISFMMPIVMLCNLVVIYYTGKLANRVNPRKILACLLLISALLIPCSYWLLSKNHSLMFAGVLILIMLDGVAAMLIPLIICTLFETPIRLTGVAFCYNIGFTLFGGMAPVLISTLINLGYNPYLIPVIYLLLIVVICSVGLKLSSASPLLVKNK